MARIHQLPQSLINKIAAGEVIERPASVVKELMENAIDAGATRVDVSIRAGGTELIRVADNGCGMAPDDLPLAIASHATSKLASAEDLFRVRTLGFRGEALASIAEVSQVVIRSRTADQTGGAEIAVNGGAVADVVPCGCPVGTIIEVRNLFFNTPVRRKFLRSTQTEMGHVTEAFQRIALASPQVHCTLRHNDHPVAELPVGEAWQERIATCFGRDLAQNLVWVESHDGDIALTGYVALPSYSRSNNRMQYFFLNGRHIRDRSLQHALGEAYRGLLLTGRFPVAFLAFHMPPDAVDVNVHPTKLEVRFQDSGRIYSQLLSTLRTKFLTTDLNHHVPAPAPAVADPTGAHDDLEAARMRQELVDWAKGKVEAWDRDDRATGTDRQTGLDLEPPSPPAPSGPLELTLIGPHFSPRPPALASGRAPARAECEPASEAHEASVASLPAQETPGGGSSNAWIGRAPAPSPKAMQVQNRYLVAESSDGLEVIDQHALHERILYEQLRSRVEANQLDVQTLLVPEPVDLSPAEAVTALEHRETLARLGLRIEPFGGGTILVSSYPAMLTHFHPGDVLRELLDALQADGKQLDRRDLLGELLHMIACKAAVKAGDRLSPDEIEALLAQRHLVDDAHHCPHGRPTALVFTNEDLDRHFKRI